MRQMFDPAAETVLTCQIMTSHDGRQMSLQQAQQLHVVWVSLLSLLKLHADIVIVFAVFVQFNWTRVS